MPLPVNLVAMSSEVDSVNRLVGVPLDRLKQLRKCFYIMQVVSVMFGLMGMGQLSFAALMFWAPTPLYARIAVALICVVLAVTNITTLVAWYKKSSYGRNLGIVTSAIALAGFPIFTIVGIVGIFGFVNGTEFFGSHRVHIQDIKSELIRRKI